MSNKEKYITEYIDDFWNWKYEVFKKLFFKDVKR